MAIVGGSAACFSSQRHSDKPCHVMVNRIGLGQDSLEIYFAKRFKNGSEAVEVRKVPVSNLQTFCGYGIVAEETDAKQEVKGMKRKYIPYTFENGDTRKELLARRRHLLFKSLKSGVNHRKSEPKILFKEYPDIKRAYALSHSLRMIFQQTIH